MMHVVFEGRVGRDPEEKVSKNGNKFYTYSVAIDMFNNGEPTTWWVTVKDFVTNRGIYQSLKKGSAVFISGELNLPTIYTRNDGGTAIDTSIFVSSVNFAMSNARENTDQQQQVENTQQPTVATKSMNDFQKPQSDTTPVVNDEEQDEPLPF